MSSSPAQVVIGRNRRRSGPVSRWCVVLTLLAVSVPAFVYHFFPSFSTASSTAPRARLSTHASIKLSVGNRPTVGLSDGHDLLTEFVGPTASKMALEQNLAEPLSLATADFDEDGTPDLVAGYSHNGRGIVTVARGNVDSVYPNAPEAKQRKVDGKFTDAPFLSPAQIFEAPIVAELIGAGDFDADGHWDVVIASRSHSALFYLPGDGRGGFAAAREIPLPGLVTAMTCGEINRRDGLTDLIVGIDRFGESGVLVFESPDGALRSTPEAFSLPARVSAVAIGQLDNSYEYDLAVAAGNELRVIYGRDRKLSLDPAQQKTVPVARQQIQQFSSTIRSLALGDFKGNSRTDIALLTDEGLVHFLEQFQASDKALTNEFAKQKNWMQTEAQSTRYPRAIELARVIVSSSSKDDLLIRDAANNELHVSIQDSAQTRSTFQMDQPPVAILPMRLNQDALQDLVILRKGVANPTIVQTAVAPQLVSFSNPSPVSISGNFGTPPVSASPYPSTINVPVSGPVDKLRVRLNGVNTGSFEQDIDILLVGPTGQKSLLMSDVDTTCVISNQNFTFDDDAQLDLSGFNCVSATYKPRDNPPGDAFGAPAPAGPYTASLANFNGTNPNGTWSLYMVCDSNFLSSQTLSGGWTLFFGPDSPQPFVVTNTNDSGAGSLRQAILDANDHLGVDNITFNIEPGGTQTITPSTPLPDVKDPVSIDATTQPGFAGKPIIELNAASVTHGLEIGGGRTVVRGLVINRCSGSCILIRPGGNNIIEGNYIGVDFTGRNPMPSQTFPAGNGNGIDIDTANNTVGGTVSAARNVIGNTTYGIIFSTFFADVASGNVIAGNYIGLNADGTAVIPMTHAGVTSRSAPGSPNNTIGGTTAGARNVIAGGVFPVGVDLVYSDQMATWCRETSLA